MNQQATLWSTALPSFDRKHYSRKERQGAKSLKADYQYLLNELYQAQAEIQLAQNNFNFLSSAKEIDVCIYQIKNAQSQYENILFKLREVQKRLQNLNDTLY